VALVVAVCNWLNAPDWVTIYLPVVICGGGRGHLGRPPGAPRTGGRGDGVE